MKVSKPSPLLVKFAFQTNKGNTLNVFNPTFKKSSKKNIKIGHFNFTLVFPLRGLKFWIFRPQIRIPCKKLYIWPNFDQKTWKSRQINKNYIFFLLVLTPFWILLVPPMLASYSQARFSLISLCLSSAFVGFWWHFWVWWSDRMFLWQYLDCMTYLHCFNFASLAQNM